MENNTYIEIRGIKHFFVEHTKEGENRPVILYVHGGPGLAESLTGWEIAGRTEAVCDWIFYDQRGAGRTAQDSPDSLVTYDEVYGDLLEIIDKTFERIGRKFYIMGHNWGTVLAIRAIRERSDKIAGYIGFEQVADMTQAARIRCMRVLELAKRAGAKRDVKSIEKISAMTDGTFDKTLMKKRTITKLNVLLAKYNVASGMDKLLMRRLPMSPIYTMADLNAFKYGPAGAFKLKEYMNTVNLFNEELEYKVPMMFISGDWDYQIPCTTMAEYFEKIKAPKKKLALIKDAGVWAMFDSPEEFWGAVLEFIEETGNV